MQIIVESFAMGTLSNGSFSCRDSKEKYEEGDLIEPPAPATGRPLGHRVTSTRPITRSSESKKAWCFTKGKLLLEEKLSGK